MEGRSITSSPTKAAALASDSFFVNDFSEGSELVGNALVDVFEPEIARPERHRLRIAPGDKSGLQTADPCERYSRAVMSAEAFGLHHNRLLALGWNRKEVNLAVRENAIHIEEQEFDFAGAGDSG